MTTSAQRVPMVTTEIIANIVTMASTELQRNWEVNVFHVSAMVDPVIQSPDCASLAKVTLKVGAVRSVNQDSGVTHQRVAWSVSAMIRDPSTTYVIETQVIVNVAIGIQEFIVRSVM